MFKSKYHYVFDIFNESAYASWFQPLYTSSWRLVARLIFESRLPLDADDLVMEALASPLPGGFEVSTYGSLRSYVHMALRRRFWRAASLARNHLAVPLDEIDDGNGSGGQGSPLLPVALYDGDFFQVVRQLPDTAPGNTWRTVFILEAVAGFQSNEAYRLVSERNWPNALPQHRDREAVRLLLQGLEEEISRLRASLVGVQSSDCGLNRDIDRAVSRYRNLEVFYHFDEWHDDLNSRLQSAAEPGNQELLSHMILGLEELHSDAKYFLSSTNLRTWVMRGNQIFRRHLRDSSSFDEINAFRAACINDGIEPHIKWVFPNTESREAFLDHYPQVRPYKPSDESYNASKDVWEQLYGNLMREPETSWERRLREGSQIRI